VRQAPKLRRSSPAFDSFRVRAEMPFTMKQGEQTDRRPRESGRPASSILKRPDAVPAGRAEMEKVVSRSAQLNDVAAGDSRSHQPSTAPGAIAAVKGSQSLRTATHLKQKSREVQLDLKRRAGQRFRGGAEQN